MIICSRVAKEFFSQTERDFNPQQRYFLLKISLSLRKTLICFIRTSLVVNVSSINWCLPWVFGGLDLKKIHNRRTLSVILYIIYIYIFIFIYILYIYYIIYYIIYIIYIYIFVILSNIHF